MCLPWKVAPNDFEPFDVDSEAVLPNVGSDHQLDKKGTRFVTCVTAFLVNKVRSWFHNESSPEQVQ